VNTPAHVIFGLAAFGKAGKPWVTAAAMAGGLIPDVSLYVLAGVHLFVLNTPPDVVFGTLYFSDAWQAVCRVDHSIVLWGLGFALALWFRAEILVAFTGAALLHSVCDLLVHHDDARAQFWPISTWVFHSPVSYWDRAHYGGIVAPLEIAVCLLLTVVLWRRYRSVGMRLVIAGLMVMEAAPGIMFMLMFRGQGH